MAYAKSMSTALQEAFDRALRLPEGEQEAIARLVTAEIEERGQLASPESALARMGRAAWAEHETGRTRPLP